MPRQRRLARRATLRSGSVWPKADPTRTRSVAFGLSFRAYAIANNILDPIPAVTKFCVALQD
ncbi:MAG: hypothetical protein F6K55_29690 [Moorea sp. SIO4A3]|nr:hypothetical protein [Moorena sp. SIO4A3]